MFFLTGCTTTRPDTSRTSSTLVSCSGKLNCSLSEEKKKGIVSKLRESGDPKARELADAIESGEIEPYEMNNAVRSRFGLRKDDIAYRSENKIYIDPNRSDALAAVDTAHEGTHVLDTTPNVTDADTLRRERAAFNTELNVWEALKEKAKKEGSSLMDSDEDYWLNQRDSGTLDDTIKDTYGLSP